MRRSQPPPPSLNRDINQLDTALDLTRVPRVQQLVARPTQLHLDVLGPPPAGPAGRAVWCHQAIRLEHHLDYSTGTDAGWMRLVNDLSITATLTRLADRYIAIKPHDEVRAAHWAPIAERVTAMHVAAIEHVAQLTPRHEFGIELGL